MTSNARITDKRIGGLFEKTEMLEIVRDYNLSIRVNPRESAFIRGYVAYTRFGILMIFFWIAYCTSCALL